MDINQILLILSVLLLLSIFVNRLAQRFALPSLLVFIVVGIFAGQNNFFKINFSDFNLAQNIGVISISYILFMGGLSVDFKEIKPIIKEGFFLATIGVLTTAIILTFLSYKLLRLGFYETFLLASIVSSTDAAAVFGILRNKHISLKANLKPLLEFESGSNDSMAIFLTLGLISLIQGHINPIGLILNFFYQTFFGILFGVLSAKFFVFIINKIKLDYANLYVVITTASVAFTYSLSSYFKINGFMAVYVLGLTMAASKLLHKRNIIRFHDALGWLFQIIMFLILGLLFDLKAGFSSLKGAVIAALILIFIARPMSVLLNSIIFARPLKQLFFVGWVGLRGAAPIVLATFPFSYNLACSSEIFNMVFYIVIISLLLQGTTISKLAQILKLNSFSDTNHIPVLEYSEIETKNQILDFKIPKNSIAIGKRVDKLNLPQNSLLVLIYKKGEYIIPKKDTLIEKNDILYVLMDKSKENLVRDKICKKID